LPRSEKPGGATDPINTGVSLVVTLFFYLFTVNFGNAEKKFRKSGKRARVPVQKSGKRVKDEQN
jgi:hypothetical protein